MLTKFIEIPVYKLHEYFYKSCFIFPSVDFIVFVFIAIIVFCASLNVICTITLCNIRFWLKNRFS